MSRLTFSEKSGVSVFNKGLAYVKALGLLISAACRELLSNGMYDVSFIKIGRKWYCEVPSFSEELFEHTLMVGGASKFLDYHAKGGGRRLSLKIGVKGMGKGDSRLARNSYTLTGGAFYNDLSVCVDEEIWLCPVTLFLLGRYPKEIHIMEMHRCMSCEEIG